MIDIQGIGFPFNPEHSSCSNNTPNTFRWSTEPQDNQIIMDNAIVNAIPHLSQLPTKRRFGWICESRAIVPQLMDILKNNTEEVVQHYEYIFTCDQELIDMHDKFKFSYAGSNIAWLPTEQHKLYEKTKMCSMIASPKQMCEGHIIRHRWAEKLKDKIDLFGGACGSDRIGFSPKHTHPDKRAALVDYRFSVTMENERYSSYFTEKITDCFVTGTVPVYWGTPNIGEYFNMDGIILLNEDFNVDDLTEERYNSMTEAIEDNFNIATSFEMSEDYTFRNYLERVAH